jgi:putative addiction module component (TIGR02574 family)
MPPPLSALLRLPKKRRLEIAEQLWLSVADEEKMPVPAEHRDILDERLAAYRSGKSKVISMAELMRRVRGPKASVRKRKTGS